MAEENSISAQSRRCFSPTFITSSSGQLGKLISQSSSIHASSSPSLCALLAVRIVLQSNGLSSSDCIFHTGHASISQSAHRVKPTNSRASSANFSTFLACVYSVPYATSSFFMILLRFPDEEKRGVK